MTRLAVFASGNGSNFQALIDAVQQGQLQAQLSLLVTDRPGARAVERAHKAGIPVLALSPRDFATKAEYEEQILKRLQEDGIERIVLAGYMRLVGPTLLNVYEGRMINIHPSLLPAFPGKEAIRQAWEAGVKVTGVTIHLVDEGMDTGPIIAQEPVRILPEDTLESLEERIHQVEHRLLVETVKQWIANTANIEG